MALILPLTNQYGTFPEAYRKIMRQITDFETRTSVIEFVSFKDAATRTAYKAARTAQATAKAALTDAYAAEDAAEDEDALEAARADCVSAREAVNVAMADMEANAPWPDTLTITVGPEDFASIQDPDGGIDTAKSYIFAKTQPECEGATDA